jgi:hypothetical protein
MNKQREAPAPFGPARGDDEIAREIVEVLRDMPSIETAVAALREAVRGTDAEPRPSEAGKAVHQVIGHAHALAACIEKLSPQWREHLRWRVFSERVDCVPVLQAALFIAAADARMNEWISNLKKIPNEFGPRTGFNPRDYSRPGPKDQCAYMARDIFAALAPTTKLMKGDSSKFCLVATKLWEAVSGNVEESMKRACDRCIDSLRETEHLLGDPTVGQLPSTDEG